MLDPYHELACISAIRPDKRKARKYSLRFLEHQFWAVPALDSEAGQVRFLVRTSLERLQF